MTNSLNHRYQRALLSRGETATIFKVTDSLGIDLPWVEKYTRPKSLRWAEQEFRALSDLQGCPQIVQVYGFTKKDDGKSVIRMEYIDGKH